MGDLHIATLKLKEPPESELAPRHAGLTISKDAYRPTAEHSRVTGKVS
jgi:hypothetical protein